MKWPSGRTVMMIVTFAALLAMAAFPVFVTEQNSLRGDDIFYAWREGERIIQGHNPYSRIHRSNMTDNRKFPTYFPGWP